MQTVNIGENTPYRRKCVLAIGMFDGLHKGHARVVKKALELAKKHNAVPCVLTFSPHPSQVINMGREPAKMIFPPARRCAEFEAAGIKKVFVKKFTKTFAKMSPEKFAEELAKLFPNLKAVITGFNFVFGHKASGNTKTLGEISKRNGWQYCAVAGKFLPDGRRISSSLMRTAVKDADFALYEVLKGKKYEVFGRAKRGKHLGSKIGIPTINIQWNPDCKPPFGAYAVELVRLKTGAKYRGIASYGTAPTVGKTEPLLEANLFENVKFGAPENFKITMLKFLRKQEKFASLDALVAAIKKDKKAAEKFFDGMRQIARANRL